MLSGQADIDHPLCEECTDTLLDELDIRLATAEAEAAEYVALVQAYTTAPAAGGETTEEAAHRLAQENAAVRAQDVHF